jgi:polar amino acid transport system substrate-binding protein
MSRFPSTPIRTSGLARLISVPVLLALIAAGPLACGGEEESERDAPGVVADSSCPPGGLATLKDGILTIGAVEPLAEPYFEDGDPANGRGFLAALGYEVAAALGYGRPGVEWATEGVGTGRNDRTDFDFVLIPEVAGPGTERRFESSDPYFGIPQAIVVPEGSDFASLGSLDQLKGARLGAVRGSAGERAVASLIEPARPARIFGDRERMLQVLGSGRLDVAVAGLPEALEGVDGVPGLEVAGQFPFSGGGDWSTLLTRGSTLVPCVNEAIESLREDGILEELARQWMSDAIEVPRVG